MYKSNGSSRSSAFFQCRAAQYPTGQGYWKRCRIASYFRFPPGNESALPARENIKVQASDQLQTHSMWVVGRISICLRQSLGARHVRLRFRRNPTLTKRQLGEMRLDEPANSLQSQSGGHPPGELSADAIRIDQSIDDFHYASPVTATRDQVDTLLERRRGVGHGH
jgi:hypothetical protein